MGVRKFFHAFSALYALLFLLALVTCASLMPVEELPLASWQTAIGLGFLAIFSWVFSTG